MYKHPTQILAIAVVGITITTTPAFSLTSLADVNIGMESDTPPIQPSTKTQSKAKPKAKPKSRPKPKVNVKRTTTKKTINPPKYKIDPDLKKALVFDKHYSYGFANDTAIVFKGKKCGYVNSSGLVFVKPQFDYCENFDKDIAVVHKNDKAAIIDINGSLLTGFDFEKHKLDTLEQGLAYITKDSDHALVNRNGKIISKYYDYTSDINKLADGLADSGIIIETDWDVKVAMEKDYAGQMSEVTHKTNPRAYAIDGNGNKVFDLIYNNDQQYSEGLLAVRNNKNKWGYINANQKVVIDHKFDRAYTFKNGFAIVKVNDKYGIIDKLGNYKVKPRYDGINHFHESLAVVKMGKKYGVIDQDENIVVEPKYAFIDDFNDGVAGARLNKEGGYGYIDKTGKVVLDFNNKSYTPFENGLAIVKDNDYKYGLINKTGKVIIPFGQYAKLRFISDKVIVADEYADVVKHVYLNTQGDPILTKYSKQQRYSNNQALSFSEGLAPVYDSGKYGYIDETGDMVISPIYTDAKRFNNGYAEVVKYGKQGFIDTNGKPLVISYK